MAFDVYQEVTNRIIEQLENGTVPWQMPWLRVSSRAVSHSTGKPYSLLNQILLGEAGEYLTFNQCRLEGGKIKKGAKSKFVVFWKPMTKELTDESGAAVLDDKGNAKKNTFFLLRYFSVFHIRDCEGIEPKYQNDPLNSNNPIEDAEQILRSYIERSGVTFKSWYQNKAYYSPTTDTISVPNIDQFSTPASYYSTVFHEATHSTGHHSRLNRFKGNEKIAAFGDENYSKEELVAEIGACLLMNEVGIESASTFQNTAAYIQGWLSKLKNDKTFIVSASSKAEKAVRLILNIEEPVIA